jgi:XTP/dITP diphosphohydrolase
MNMPKKLVFATHNKHKLVEIQQMLEGDYQLVDLNDIGCHNEIPENESTLQGNALAKAMYVKQKFGFDCFADDTGLEVAVLNGAPGVFSARYAGEQKNSEDNMNKLLQALENKEDRSAQFRTVIALVLGEEKYLFEGVVKGKIMTERRGDGGFGYDPIFMADGETRTFAQMPMAEKAAMSHRGRAVEKLMGFLAKL